MNLGSTVSKVLETARGRRCWWIGGLLALILVPNQVQANNFATPPAKQAVADGHQVLINHHLGEQTQVETIRLKNTASQLVYLRAFPSEPQVTQADADFFEVVANQSQARAPFSEQLRDRPFGPSLLTVLHRQYFLHEEEPEEEPPAARTLQLNDWNSFQGATKTSTVDGQTYLPQGLENWLYRQGTQLSARQRRELARYLDKGWWILALNIYDKAPSEQMPAQIGPLRFSFKSRQAVYPLPYPSLMGGVPHEMYVVAGNPLVSQRLDTVLAAEPWRKTKYKMGVFKVTLSEQLSQRESLAFYLKETQSIAIPATAHLNKFLFQPGKENLAEVAFVPVNKRPTTLKADLPRGSTADIIYCLLLGLTPLICTPESWLLMWLTGQARSRSRSRSKPTTSLTTKLWTIFPIIVATYWFLTLEGLARTAAILPIVVGMIQLSFPYSLRDPAPVRAKIHKKKDDS